MQCSQVISSGIRGGEKFSVSALVISSPLPSAVRIERYPHLCELQLADDYSVTPGEIDVLIESNLYWRIVASDIVRGDHGPVAVKSKLGWLLSGTVETFEAKQINHAHVVITGDPASPLQERDDVLVESLRKFWEVESLGIVDPPSISATSNLFLPSLIFENGHYEVGLPWKCFQWGVPTWACVRIACSHCFINFDPNLRCFQNMITLYENN